jgi:hypothetical protein
VLAVQLADGSVVDTAQLPLGFFLILLDFLGQSVVVPHQLLHLALRLFVVTTVHLDLIDLACELILQFAYLFLALGRFAVGQSFEQADVFGFELHERQVMFLFELLIPALQVVLDLDEQVDLLLVLAQLLGQTLVVVVTLPVNVHELVQRFLHLVLRTLQSFVLVAATLQSDLQILVHLVRRDVVLGQFALVGEDLLAQRDVGMLVLLQTRGQFVVLLIDALVHQLVFYQFLLLPL